MNFHWSIFKGRRIYSLKNSWILCHSENFRFPNRSVEHFKPLLVGGGGNPMGTSESQNQGPSPPKPDTWGRYKVFCLKDHILSAKKKRGPSNITFSIFGYVGQLEATGRKRTSWLKRCLLDFCQLIWHYNPPDSIQSHPTPSRHLPDTLQTPHRHPKI